SRKALGDEPRAQGRRRAPPLADHPIQEELTRRRVHERPFPTVWIDHLSKWDGHVDLGPRSKERHVNRPLGVRTSEGVGDLVARAKRAGIWGQLVPADVGATLEADGSQEDVGELVVWRLEPIEPVDRHCAAK